MGADAFFIVKSEKTDIITGSDEAIFCLSDGGGNDVMSYDN